MIEKLGKRFKVILFCVYILQKNQQKPSGDIFSSSVAQCYRALFSTGAPLTAVANGRKARSAGRTPLARRRDRNMQHRGKTFYRHHLSENQWQKAMKQCHKHLTASCRTSVSFSGRASCPGICVRRCVVGGPNSQRQAWARVALT